MGISILELVLRLLREKGIQADAAYPGQKFPAITGPVAAVHIEKVDRAELTVTLEVSVLCPAAMGGTQCELEALRVTEILRWAGAVCTQNGCTYDGVAQVYSVAVLAVFTAVTEADTYRMGPGFYVYIDGLHHPYVVSMSAERAAGLRAEYTMGTNAPSGFHRNPGLWQIRVEERIPTGCVEDPEPGNDFEIKVITDGKTELYTGCNWESVRREHTRGGLRRIRSGIALTHLEV